MEFDTRDRTIGHVLARLVERHGGKVFLTFIPDGRTFTYRDLDIVSNRIANGLLASGITRETHVGVMMENSPEQLLLFLALGKVGAIAVPINTAARGQQLRHLLELSESTVLALDDVLVDVATESIPALPALKTLIILSQEFRPELEVKLRGTTCIDYHTVAACADSPVDVTVKFTDVAFLSYTSGTTGPSKLSIYPQAHCIGYGANNATEHDYRPDDVAYVCLPMFHVSALFGVTYAAMLAGASVVMTTHFSTGKFWADIRRYQVTLFNCLGAMSEFLWNQPPSAADREHHVRLCRMVPVPRYANLFEERFGVKIVSGYALSDFGQVTAFTAKDPTTKLGSAGRARRGIEIRIVDDDDLDMPKGQVGEIVVRSNNPWNTSLGYYGMPEATVAATRNMWFHTGDRGYLDADDYLYFIGRKKDSIRRRGENISSMEVEQVIANHPAVVDVAVYPVRAAAIEEEVAATVVLKEGHSTCELEIVEYCLNNMAYYMVPRYIKIASDLPRNLSHRVQKFKLIEEAEENLAALFDREMAGVVLRRQRSRT